MPCPTQVNTLEYEYSLQFHGIESELSKALCFLLADGGMDSDFSLTDGPAAHLQLVVDNINRIKGTTAWKIGSVIAADNKVITYDGIDCLTALNRIAETFETEWWIVGTTIYLSKCEHGELLELGYAADGNAVGGLLNLSKREEENEKFFTRLYAKGSTRNIDRSKYGSDYLRLPSPLKYLERNTEYGIVEREVIFEEVYPRRVGTLSGVRSVERETEDKTIRVYYVTDKDMPFDPNDYEIAGLVKRVAFQTGELSGYDFEVNYDSSTGEFELINQYPDENTQVPDGIMTPQSGDTYILYNIRMPDEYYTLAENELKEVSEAYLAKHSIDSSVYSGDSDPIILRQRGAVITPGQRVRLYNSVFFKSGHKDSRIISLTRNVHDPYDVRVDISDTVTSTWRESIERKVDSFLPMLSQGGEAINIIKSGDDTVPTDNNVFSALRAISTFLRKDRPDQTKYLIKFLGGLISDNIESQDFAAGPFGTGYVLKRNQKTGKSYMEIDELYVRLKAYFDTLEIKHLSHVGGRIVLSPASMECIKVEEVSAENEKVYDSTGEQVYDSLNDEARAWFLKMEQGDEEALEIWQWFRDISLKEFMRVYDILGMEFDSFAGESFYRDKTANVVKRLTDDGLLKESQGAMIVPLDEYDMPPCIVSKKDGSSIYATRDLAAILYRKETYNFERCLYVTGLEQKLHFAQVFKVIELMGNDYAKNLIHIPYGLVSLKSGKISSRKGNVIFAEDLLRESINKTTSIIDEKNPDIPDKEEVAKQVGIGAIIFNDLYNQRIKDVIFDWEKLLNFDGETGPYVQYTYARASSVLRKIGEVPDTIDYDLLTDEASIGLLKEIERYPQIIKDAADRYEPSVIARYSIDLAHAFNKFYHECQINVEDETTKYTRTNVVKIVRYIIKDALSLLGIQCPEQM